MCGRIWQGGEMSGWAGSLNPESLQDMTANHFNLAPSQTALVMVRRDGLQMLPMRFGLIPAWAADESIGNKMINARAETVAEKVSFKKLFVTQRGLIPVKGFYEWKREKPRARPFLFHLKSREVFTLAGLWSRWARGSQEEVLSFAIITTAANDLMRPIHHRMPVIIPAHRRDAWLDPAQRDADVLRTFLEPYDSAEMEAYEVSTFVNIPGHDSEECIRPLGPAGAQ